MSKVFYAAIHYGVNERGYLAFNSEDHSITVSLPDSAWEDKVRAYLGTPQVIHHATGLDTYEPVTVTPTASEDDMRLALTHMWDAIGVQVDWSRPAEVNGEFKFND